MTLRTATVLGSFLVTGSALAHGPQLQVSLDDNNQIVTRQIIDTTNAAGLPGGHLAGYETLTDPTRVYVIPAYLNNTGEYSLQPDNPHYLNGPGYAFRYESDTPGTNMFFDNAPLGRVNLQDGTFSIQYVSGLSVWDGGAFVDAGDTQLFAARSSGGTLQTMTTRDGAAAADVIALGTLTSPSANPHGSLTHLLLGDGVDSASALPDGVFRVSLQMFSTNGDISASDPFDYVIYKGVGVSDAIAAAESLTPAGPIQVVPEPASLGLLAAGGVLLTRRRRRT